MCTVHAHTCLVFLIQVVVVGTKSQMFIKNILHNLPGYQYEVLGTRVLENVWRMFFHLFV